MQKVQKLTTRMADGRELIWFDGPDHAPRDPAGLVDARDLPRVVPASQLRYDALATLSAEQAFIQRRANCLSYTMLLCND